MNTQGHTKNNNQTLLETTIIMNEIMFRYQVIRRESVAFLWKIYFRHQARDISGTVEA